MNVTKSQAFWVGLLTLVFFVPLDLAISAYFNNIIVSWLMTVLLMVWVYTAVYSARNLRRFEGNDRWLLLIIVFFAPAIAFLFWLGYLGQLPKNDSA